MTSLLATRLPQGCIRPDGTDSCTDEETEQVTHALQCSDILCRISIDPGSGGKVSAEAFFNNLASAFEQQG